MFLIDKHVKSSAIVDFRHLLENADSQMLNEEVSVFDNLLTVLNPLHFLTETVFIKTKYEQSALNHTAEQTSAQKLGFHKDGSRVGLFEFIGTSMENSLGVLWQRPEATR